MGFLSSVHPFLFLHIKRNIVTRVSQGMASQVLPHGVYLPFIPASSATSGFGVVLCIGGTVREFVIFIRFLRVGVGSDLSCVGKFSEESMSE